MRARAIVLVGLSTLVVRAAFAQAPVPVRPLGPTQANSPPMFKAITNVRVLSDGRVLVNDATGHRVVLLDASLARATTVFDSTIGAPTSYGTGNGGLQPLPADSTLILDHASRSLVVIDPTGTIARVAPLPNQRTLTDLTDPGAGPQWLSSVFGFVRSEPAFGQFPERPPPGAPPVSFLLDDTSYVVAYSVTTRKADTLATVATGNGTIARMSATGISIDQASLRTAPFRVHDDWAVLSDGSIAVVRGRDYGIDWINTNGTRSSSPPIAHEWQHYSPDEKVHVADSLNSMTRRNDSVAVDRWMKDSTAIANGKEDSLRALRMKAFSGLSPAATNNVLQNLLSAPRPVPGSIIQPGDLPDSLPPLASTDAARGDADDNLWIRARQLTRVTDGTVYDIVNRQGVLIDRVKIPLGRMIVGFGPNGVVYMAVHDRGGVALQRARWK